MLVYLRISSGINTTTTTSATAVLWPLFQENRPTSSVKALKAVNSGRKILANLCLMGNTHTPIRMGRYQIGKTNLDFTEARDIEWQWYQLGHMQACTSIQTDNHASIPLLSFLQAGCPSCRPTNSVKVLKA